VSSRIHRRRVEALEEQVRPERGPTRSTGARERMKAHLSQVAALRRGELSEEEAAEVMATNALIEARMQEIRAARGEGVGS
jgi:hypothetical protein